MYAQLGTTRFDGAKSFVTFSDTQEPVIVEHALISRKPRLQPAGLGLRNISLSLFLHQEYCKVTDEINSLRTSMNAFEVLPLLWGNGTLEGDFVIASMEVTLNQMDAIGNTIAATVSISLKESYNADLLTQKQIDAQKAAFAVGDKTPPTKSNRVNEVPCPQQIRKLISGIGNNAAVADRYCRGYTNIPGTNARLKFVLNRIVEDTQKVITAAGTPSSCASKVSGLAVAGSNVIAKANQLQADIKTNETQYPNLVITPVNLAISGHNTELQSAVLRLDSTAAPITTAAIIKR